MKHLLLALTLLLSVGPVFAEKPHAVFLVGTPHYNPTATMPPLAAQLGELGFKTTVINPKGNPEKKKEGIAGLEVIQEADVLIVFTRFLTLPEAQFAIIQKHIEAGKPLVGFRTTGHGYAYPKGHPLHRWNHDFGKLCFGSKYFIHGSSGTHKIDATEAAKGHPVARGVELTKAAGTLYLSEVPADANVLYTGTGDFKRAGKVTNGFGTHDLKKTMTDDIAWTWKNQWGGRVFNTTMGHPTTFGDENFVRLCLNGIHWAVGKDVPEKGCPATPILVKEKHAPVAAKKPTPVPVVNPAPAPKAALADQSKTNKLQDAKNKTIDKPQPANDPDLGKYGIYANKAPKAKAAPAVETTLPLELREGDRIAYIGNTLLDQMGSHGFFETHVQQAFPEKKLTFRNLSWSADAIDVQPRPANLATVEQHLVHERASVIFASFGFNESFAGPDGIDDFKAKFSDYVETTRSKTYDGESAPRLVFVSPIPNENVPGVKAGDLNNVNLASYSQIMKQICAEKQVAYADVFSVLQRRAGQEYLTFNGCHLSDLGYMVFSSALFHTVFGKEPPALDIQIRDIVVDKNRQFFRRYRPVNSFYYTGGRNKSYGYLDFLPAMRNFDLMVQQRDSTIHALAAGGAPPEHKPLPELPPTKASRGANEWMSAAEELESFIVDDRFEVTLFAGEEEFPDIACPVQIRFDSKGRMWVSTSTTYPHVYPGNEPNDKLVILEDRDGNGKADHSEVWADDLHIPLDFEFGDGGVYVSEEPHFNFLSDTDNDGKADTRKTLMTGFGCEDSHHALHDFVWTPDGDLIFRESIFHHSQIETPYGPVRQQNSGWFRFTPRTHKLTGFGTYHSTNPWGVTFDKWGQHVASHPVYAAAFHALDPVYPEQHPKPGGMNAYSGTCGQEFVDFPNWPEEMQGGYVKVRYKPTNRVEFHKWVDHGSYWDEEYVGDLIFSKNLSFIPVDIKYGPDGAMYICDWYNPVKGHAQYSLRDERRDRHSGRIWRIMPKGAEPSKMPKMAGASIEALLEILKRPEYRYRYWARRELRSRDHKDVEMALDNWVGNLDPKDPNYLHHETEALWMYRSIDAPRPALLAELITSDDKNARMAATEQLRYWHTQLPGAIPMLKERANDENGTVRLQAAIAASWIGTEDALLAMLDTLNHPTEKHLGYAIRTSLGSATLKRHWENNEQLNASHPELKEFYANWNKQAKMAPKSKSSATAQFDTQKGLVKLEIGCVSERMQYTTDSFKVKPGAPVKLHFVNPDATPHNLVILKKGASVEKIGTAANLLATDPKEAEKGEYIPKTDQILFKTKMVKPESSETLRFMAPKEKGTYPFLCTFPGHWILMQGEMVVE